MRQQELDSALDAYESYVLGGGDSVPNAPFSRALTDLYGADLSADDDSRGLVISGRSNLKGLKLDGANLAKIKISHCVLDGVSFDGANLAGAQISNCNFDGASLQGANCTGVSIEASALAGSNFTHAILLQAKIAGCPEFYKGTEREGTELVNLEYAHLDRATIHMSQLGGANLQGASMTGIYLRFVELNKANLSGADMCAGTTRHAKITNANCTGLVATHGDFAGLVLEGSDLTGSDFSYSNFGNCEAGAASSISSFFEADLEGSKLDGAGFDNCDVGRANFRNTSLKRSRFDGCRMSGSSFNRASVDETTFNDCNWGQWTYDGMTDQYSYPTANVSQLTTPATIKRINNALKQAANNEWDNYGNSQVVFGLTGKLKIINYQELERKAGKRLFNPFPGKTDGRIYTAFTGAKIPTSEDNVITLKNLGYYSVADIMYGIRFLFYQWSSND